MSEYGFSVLEGLILPVHLELKRQEYADHLRTLTEAFEMLNGVLASGTIAFRRFNRQFRLTFFPRQRTHKNAWRRPKRTKRKLSARARQRR